MFLKVFKFVQTTILVFFHNLGSFFHSFYKHFYWWKSLISFITIGSFYFMMGIPLCVSVCSFFAVVISSTIQTWHRVENLSKTVFVEPFWDLPKHQKYLLIWYCLGLTIYCYGATGSFIRTLIIMFMTFFMRLIRLYHMYAFDKCVFEFLLFGFVSFVVIVCF